MSGGGGGDTPVPGKEKSVTDTSSKTKATGTTTPTLPPWLSTGLEQNFQGYLGGVDQFGNAIQNWSAAPFTPDQLAGFEMQRQAVSGERTQTPLDQLLATARGDYLYGGPGFTNAVDAAYRAGVPGTLSQFGGQGRDENFLGKAALNQIYSDAFARQYENERGLQQNAQQILPQLSLLPGQTYGNIGQQQQQLAQYGINYPLETLFPQLFQAQQGATGFAGPFLGQTSSQTGNTSGSSTVRGTTTPSYFPGSGNDWLGAGLAGAGTGAMLTPGMPLLGAGVGAGVGIGSTFL